MTGDFRKIAELIGVENALKVSAKFGGLTVSIPKLTGLKRQVRDKKIKDAYDSGVPVRRLAMNHDLTQRQIYNILWEQGRKPTDG